MFDSIPHELEHRKEVYDRMKGAGGCLAIPVYDGAQDAVRELRSLVDVTIVTSPFPGSPTWMSERERWLAEHFGIDRDNIFHGEKKWLVHGDILLDDKESHVDTWEKYWQKQGQNPLGLLWHTNRNVAPAAHVKVVKSWANVIDQVKQYSTNNP